jgi:hypothetical protein
VAGLKEQLSLKQHNDLGKHYITDLKEQEKRKYTLLLINMNKMNGR